MRGLMWSVGCNALPKGLGEPHGRRFTCLWRGVFTPGWSTLACMQGPIVLAGGGGVGLTWARLVRARRW